MTTLKEWMDEQWRNPGVRCAGHGVAYMMEGGKVVARAGTQRTYLDKETKRRRAKLAMYSEKLRPIILAEATQTVENVECAVLNEYGRPVKNGNVTETEVKRLPVYRWPAHTKPEPVAAIPRKRVPKAKLEQAAAIIAKVPQDELTAFLARFGLSLSLAAHLVALGDPTMIARQFLRATL